VKEAFLWSFAPKTGRQKAAKTPLAGQTIENVTGWKGNRHNTDGKTRPCKADKTLFVLINTLAEHGQVDGEKEFAPSTCPHNRRLKVRPG